MTLEQQLAKVTGEGAALAYFTAYLRRILPTISEDIRTWCEEFQLPPSKTSFVFYIIVPKSGQCQDNFGQIDQQIQPSSNVIPDLKTPRAGDQSRKLTRSMQVIKDKDQSYYFCGEFASPLKTLQGIFDLLENPATKEMFLAQVKRFATIMEDLSKFAQTKQYAQKYKIIRFDDGGERALSDILVENIKSDVAQRQASGATP